MAIFARMKEHSSLLRTILIRYEGEVTARLQINAQTIIRATLKFMTIPHDCHEMLNAILCRVVVFLDCWISD